MTIGIDMEKLLEEQFNNIINRKLLESTSDKRLDSNAGKLAKALIELCNKHNMYGFEAISFITDLLLVLEKSCNNEEGDKK